MSKEKYQEYYKKIETDIKAGMYTTKLSESRLKEWYTVIDSSKSVDWNKLEVQRWNKDELPQLREAYKAETERLKDLFNAEIETLFLTLSLVTPKMAKKLRELTHWHHIDRHDLSFTGSNNREYCLSYLSETEELADIFFD